MELIEKISDFQVTDERLFSHPLVQELLKQVSIPRTRDQFTWSMPLEVKEEGERIIAGYASVDLVDKQGDMIPLDVLRKAWDKFTASPEFMTSQLLHSNVPIGKFILSHPKVDKKAGVDKQGLFVICKVRDDIKKGDEAWDMIKSGQLKAFSIGGEAIKRSMVCDGRCYKRIDELELHEISIVSNPANEACLFTIIKSERLLKLDDVLTQLPEGMILVKDFISLVGSVVEKGISKHDFDLLVRHGLDENSFLRRAILARIQKQFPDRKVGRGEEVDVFFGDQAGPHDSYVPVYDLVLLKRNPLETVPMKIEKCPECVLKGESGRAEILKGMLEDLNRCGDLVSEVTKADVCKDILILLKKSSEEIEAGWSDEAREAAAIAREKYGKKLPKIWMPPEKPVKIPWKERPVQDRFETGVRGSVDKVEVCSGILKTLNGIHEELGKVWSDEAREAAAEARAGNYKAGDHVNVTGRDGKTYEARVTRGPNRQPGEEDTWMTVRYLGTRGKDFPDSWLPRESIMVQDAKPLSKP